MYEFSIINKKRNQKQKLNDIRKTYGQDPNAQPSSLGLGQNNFPKGSQDSLRT